jgi:hypothetical protein
MLRAMVVIVILLGCPLAASAQSFVPNIYNSFVTGSGGQHCRLVHSAGGNATC